MKERKISDPKKIDNYKMKIEPLLSEMIRTDWKFPNLFTEKVPFRFIDLHVSKNLPSPTILQALEQFGEQRNENGYYYVKEFYFLDNLLEPSKTGLESWFIPFSSTGRMKYCVELWSWINFLMISPSANWVLVGLEEDDIFLFAGTKECGEEILKNDPVILEESQERFLRFVELMYEKRKVDWLRWIPELFIHLFFSKKN